MFAGQRLEPRSQLLHFRHEQPHRALRMQADLARLRIRTRIHFIAFGAQQPAIASLPRVSGTVKKKSTTCVSKTLTPALRSWWMNCSSQSTSGACARRATAR